MNPTISKSEWQRIEHWLIWIAAIGILLFLLVPLAADKADVQRIPAEQHKGSGDRLKLPFTAWSVAEYFSTTLEMSVENNINHRFVFENQHGTVPEDFWHIEIWTESENLVVQFTVGGDYGMTLAREFFESPLFERSETEKLYEMLSQARNNPVAKLPRFTVSMAYREQANLQMLNMKFVPLSAIHKG